MNCLQTVTIISASLLMLCTSVISDTSTMCSVVQGLPGLNGRDGRNGANGLKGDPGPPGETGSPGIRGISGPPGKVGPKGDKGNIGVAGAVGEKGDRGLRGEKGDKGSTGAVGEKGDRGLRGEKGDKGSTGAVGEKGDRGLRGEKGDKGSTDTTVTSKVSTIEYQLQALERKLSKLIKGLSFRNEVQFAGNKMYVTNGKKENYKNAEAECRRIGGTLPIPLNNEENNAMFEFVKAHNIRVYLGINDINQEGDFRDLNGKTISYTKWNPNEPNNDRNEDCAEVTSNGGWNDRICDDQNLVVCEF